MQQLYEELGIDKEVAAFGESILTGFLKIAIGGTDIHKVPVGVIMTRMPNITS